MSQPHDPMTIVLTMCVVVPYAFVMFTNVFIPKFLDTRPILSRVLAALLIGGLIGLTLYHPHSDHIVANVVERNP